jgi:predicted enzyme related to lactoylglutathione lyase
MSMLHTPDTEGAIGFYASMFGWTDEPLRMGDQTITLFRLPGYVGGEPGQPVPRDVVAVMVPIADVRQVPHWSVDFWIDDADAAATKAGGLGGAVVVSPHDTPGFRNAALADPGGAVFSVSTLQI